MVIRSCPVCGSLEPTAAEPIERLQALREEIAHLQREHSFADPACVLQVIGGLDDKIYILKHKETLSGAKKV